MISVDIYMKRNGNGPFYQGNQIEFQDLETRYTPRVFRNYSLILTIDLIYLEVLDCPHLFTNKKHIKKYSAEHYERKENGKETFVQSTSPNDKYNE